MAQDPFHSAQGDLQDLLAQCRPLLQSYLRIRSSASSANSPELVEARHELESTLTDLTQDLQDLVDSVKAVEGDPTRYGLSVSEVGRRKKLVGDVANEVEDMHRQLNSTVQIADARRQSLAHPDSFAAGAEDGDPLADQDGDDGYGEWEEQRQMEMMHEQDNALDGVFQTVGNLRLQADTMGRELEEQAEMLEETENITDRVTGKVAKGMKGVRHMIERNEGEFAAAGDGGVEVTLELTDSRSVEQLLHCCAHIRPDTAVDIVTCPVSVDTSFQWTRLGPSSNQICRPETGIRARFQQRYALSAMMRPSQPVRQ